MIRLSPHISLILTTCAKARTFQVVTPSLEVYSLTYCPESECSDMKATKKTVLFGKATVNKAVHQWPVAVFANAGEATAYATFLRLAYRAKDTEAITALDPSHAKDEKGAPLFDVKWAKVELPYSPLPELEADDDAVKTETPTS